ncbi:hypothetical protein [Polynucleobacter necessarius]|nr:hypothetical protein [Polynucleobacter necessarius]
MTTYKPFIRLENSSRREFIIKGTMIGGGLMLRVEAHCLRMLMHRL